MNPNKIRFVIATRANQNDFFTSTAMGKVLNMNWYSEIETDIYASNSRGLPQVYNESIERSKSDPAILVFAHDDIHLSDFYWFGNLINGLTQFDIVGVVGNKRRVPRQPSWAFIDDGATWDEPDNLSGIVGAGIGFPPVHMHMFGPPGHEVKLLDGLFLAVRSELLIQHDLKFDERFDFHFYDLDFCRQAESKGMRMGTWGISIIHESGGGLGTPSWKSAYAKYLEKWKD